MSVSKLFPGNIPSWRIAFVVSMILLFVYEIYEDLAAYPNQISVEHILELVIIGLLILFFVREIRQTEKMREQVQQATAASSRLSGKYVDHINMSFDQWGLTKAENEIAWLLLKGFSFTEIAAFRGVLEKTIRQQATRVYSKADVSGRIELVGYFMEDFLASDSANPVTNNKAT